MDANRKNTISRTILLLAIAGMLAAIAVKLNFGKEIAKSFEGPVEEAKQVESANSKSKTQNGQFTSEELSDVSGDPRQLPVTTSQSQAVTQILRDNSKVNRMDDGFGNLTVTRTFRGDKLLRMVLIRNNKNRQRNVFVYTKSGKVKILPEKYADRALFAPASEIASAAKVYDSVNENQMRKQRISLVRERHRSEAEEKRRSEEIYEAPTEIVDTEPVPENMNESEPDIGDQEDG